MRVKSWKARSWKARSCEVRSWQIGLLSFLATVLLIACPRSPFPPSVQQTTPQIITQPATILVAAATSLQGALQEITPFYTQAHPSQTINYNFAASGLLQQQIEQGAPVDVFISAADKQMNALQKQGLLESGTPKELLTNQLVLITPKQTSVALMNFQQLVKPEVQRISIGEPRTVPAGQYATEVLKNLKILEKVQSKFVLGNNVKSVLTAVEIGNVDAGIVYITDVKHSNKVMVVTTAKPTLHSPIHYPIAVLKSSQSLDAAKQYVVFLQSPPAQAIFKKHGFGIAKS